MEYRYFGNTELKVSSICYGTMRYANKSGNYDEQTKAGDAALNEAIDRGVNFIHSSNEYGTRWLTGRVLEKHPKRHELHHIIKVNVPDWGDPYFDPSAFRSRIEEALKELHTERIAVVQHLQRGEVDPEIGYCAEGEPKRLADLKSVNESLLETFEKLRDEGKVGYLSSFPYTAGFAEKVVESEAFSGIVAYFDALETEMLDLFPDMKSRGMGFIGIRPFAAGILTDRRVDREKLPPDDRFQDSQFDRFYDQLSQLRSRLKEDPQSWTRFAIRFSLSHPVIASTVVGINTPEQLQDILAAADEGVLPDDTVTLAHQVCTEFRKRFGVKANKAGVPVY